MALFQICPPNYFTCNSGTITCIQELFRCDCTPDCVDDSDENWTWAGCETFCSGAPGTLDRNTTADHVYYSRD